VGWGGGGGGGFKTQIYRRSDGFSCNAHLKNQYIFVFIIEASSWSVGAADTILRET